MDVFKAKRSGREMAREMGFNSRDYTAVEITVAELATNILRHAGQGVIRVEAIENGLEISSEDEGPGIADAEGAMAQKKTGRAGLGIGLEGVKRLMDQVEIFSEPGRGARIVARKWKQKPAHLIRKCQDHQVPRDGLLEYGVVSTPYLGMSCNGDAFVIRESSRQALIAVIDGLGHGEAAHDPSQLAAGYIQDNYEAGLTSIIHGCHTLLRRTRGAVIGLIKVDLERAILSHAGVGNISVKILGRSRTGLISDTGIVGHNIGTIHEEQAPYQKGDIIFIHSDGISDRFTPHELKDESRGLQEIAEQAVREYGRDHDDATIIVARERA
jgi:anti-sigma regulatory factor (Ser/Thr protein kinase)